MRKDKLIRPKFMLIWCPEPAKIQNSLKKDKTVEQILHAPGLYGHYQREPTVNCAHELQSSAL